ncbi:auxin-induced protein 6B-like protein [Cinnamomum micranthum f. kanehirae]|uniref:Auxin-induced protein 6B-like protein n=1 Tax=Cinnamomum micranthum f. kanehirae TaxID=337451 RepID=A0A3S3QYY7_9MAGN|nr:auxin-induced protein 6B-like protein [Cinnamomum micranthum f. kanehirae]
MQEEKKMKVKKGCLSVRVGHEDDEKRFTIPIWYLYHPLLKRLLEKAQDVYGFHTTGPLRLPCSVDEFLHLRWLIERESQHHQYSNSFSFHGC